MPTNAKVRWGLTSCLHICMFTLLTTDVLVLEKNAVAGGRVRRITLPSLPDQHFDAGAAWIHGTSGNPVAEIAEAMGMRTVTSTEGRSWLRVYGSRQLSWGVC
jgi:phytoene dehydrogenase-like protein